MHIYFNGTGCEETPGWMAEEVTKLEGKLYKSFLGYIQHSNLCNTMFIVHLLFFPAQFTSEAQT